MMTAKRNWRPNPSPILSPYCTAPPATTAMAPVAPEIMPGRPPKAAVINPINTAAQRPTKGSTPAIKENAMASGTRARATVNPESVSSLKLPFFFSEKLEHGR